jgi:hypothetical protein
MAGSLHQKRGRDLAVKIGGEAPSSDGAADILPFLGVQLPAAEPDSFREYRVQSNSGLSKFNLDFPQLPALASVF